MIAVTSARTAPGLLDCPCQKRLRSFDHWAGFKAVSYAKSGGDLGGRKAPLSVAGSCLYQTFSFGPRNRASTYFPSHYARNSLATAISTVSTEAPDSDFQLELPARSCELNTMKCPANRSAAPFLVAARISRSCSL